MIVVKYGEETLQEALERTSKEKREQDIEWQKPKDWNFKFSVGDKAVRVITDGFYKEIYFCDEYYLENLVSFKELLEVFGIKKPKKYSVIYVWIEDALSGEIWQYGNYPNSDLWHYHGETRGYA